MNLSGSQGGFKPGRSLPSMPIPTSWGTLRRPIPPFPLEIAAIHHPELPPELDGFSILHLTDLHSRRGRPATPFVRELASSLAYCPVDLAVFTGDAMDHPGDESAALTALGSLLASCRARHGVLAVFGNHDSSTFRAAASQFPGIRWLRNQSLTIPGLPLRILGPEDPADLLATCLCSPDPTPAPTPHPTPHASPRPSPAPFTIALSHYPTDIYPAAEFGIHLLLAGHTHGGQLRLSPDLAPHTSTDLPGRLACGILRLRSTLCAVPRGLGQAVVELRFNCPPQAPTYILKRGPFSTPTCPNLRRLEAW